MFQALWRLRSQRCRFTIIDAPGHDDFTKDIVTAMSQADIAVLVVTAVQADLEDGIGCEVQIREHALLAYTLGLRQIVVCVNKMDCDAVAYSQDHFGGACASVRDDLETVGLRTHDVHFVPISGWMGDNVAYRSANMPWYCGPTLLEAMDDAVASCFKPERPLRLPLQDVMQIGGQGVVAVGRVAAGSLRQGMELVFAPGHVRAEVLSIRMHHESLDEAGCGDNVNVSVGVAMKELRRGMVGSAADDNPAIGCSSFLAQVIVLPPSEGRERTSREIAKGCTLWVECHTAQVPCEFEELVSRTDRRTGQVLETNPATLHAGDAAVVRLRPETPFCVEAFSEYPPLGRFAVRDQKATVAVGVVQQVDPVPDSRWAGAPPMLRRTASSRGAKAHSRHSAVKPKAHGRLMAHDDGDGLACAVDDAADDKPLRVASGVRPPRPKPPDSPVTKRGTRDAVATDSGDDSPETTLPVGLSRPKADSPATKRAARAAIATDSGEDSPRIVLPSGTCVGSPGIIPSGLQSPFVAFTETKNPSPFAAFGAVTNGKKMRDSPPNLRFPPRQPLRHPENRVVGGDRESSDS